jgi:hypothetical protein
MNSLLKPAQDILEELETYIASADKPADMFTHMQNARRIRDSLDSLEMWTVDARRTIFVKKDSPLR